MQSLSRRVLAAVESQTLAISARAKKMKLSGIDVVSLSTGEPDFPTPDCAKEAAMEAIRQNFTQYTDSNGILELREAVAHKFRVVNGILDAQASNVLISCGAKQSVMNTLTALCNPEDEVIVVAPYWVSYPAMVALAGSKPVIVDTSAERGFLMTPQQLKNALTPQTKCIILNSPSNPTGAMYSEEQFREIADVLDEHDCYVISDEIYERIHYGSVQHVSIGSFKNLGHRVITVNGSSKAYAMTGWRIGFMHAPEEVYRQASKVQSQDTSNPNSVAQRAALAALLYADSDVEKMRLEFQERRQLIAGLVGEVEGCSFLLPDGAFYLWVDVSQSLTKDVPTTSEFCELLLDKYHCALVPGEAFGLGGHVRFSFAASHDSIEKGVRRFSDCLASLR